MKMESVCKILENFSLIIYPVRFRRYSDEGCIFIESDIINFKLRIRMRNKQRKIGSHIITAKTTVISPDFLVWKFCGKAQFPSSFERFARKYAETMSFRKISTPRNQVKLLYFSQYINR